MANHDESRDLTVKHNTFAVKYGYFNSGVMMSKTLPEWTARKCILRGDVIQAADVLKSTSNTYLSHEDIRVRDMAIFISSLEESKILELLGHRRQG